MITRTTPTTRARNRTLAILALLTAIPAAAADRAEQILAAFRDAASPEVLVVAHRGDHDHYPENSIPSIVSSAELGAHIVEIDIRRTSDGHYVLMHDSTIDRTTAGTGRVTDLTLTEILATPLKMKTGETTDLFPPTLGQAFEAARGRVMLNIDLKNGDLQELVGMARDADILDHLLFKYRWNKMSPELHAWIAANPDVIFMPIAGSKKEVQAALDTGPMPAFEIFFQSEDKGLGTAESMAWLADNGARPWANTLGSAKNSAGWMDKDAVNDPDAVWGHAVRHGVSMIQTDHPGECVAFLRTMGRVKIEPAASASRD